MEIEQNNQAQSINPISVAPDVVSSLNAGSGGAAKPGLSANKQYHFRRCQQ
ncbi:hypothetical protein [Hymenobacter metallilatus]|uniref:hypothetical protein n=1 Tax=Hymenobacter metallilatus TaxID=2493666 RepID=UPI00163B5C86|nr:hypothetical protein [Hymenobacter metallilatus]